MVGRKIYCEVVEGVVYDDRCLFKLSKIIEGNKTCETCIVREAERIRCPGIKEAQAKVKREKKVKRKKRSDLVGDIPKDIKEPEDINESDDIKQSDDTKQAYSIRFLSKFLGKAERTIQLWAQKGRIPAHKVGGDWQFPKKGIDLWLSEKGHCNDVVLTMSPPSQEEDVCPPDQNNEGPS